MKKGSNVAGKIFNSNETTKDCLNPTLSKLSLKDDIQNKGEDLSHSHDVHQITHGVSSQSSIHASDLINPDKKSLFQQRLLDKKEDIYVSKKSPLGKSRMTKSYGEQDGLNEKRLGVITKPDSAEAASAIINPKKTLKEVEEQSKAGHEMYVITHHDYDVGETCNRRYDWSKTNANRKIQLFGFGVETPHCNNGQNVAETLRWMDKRSPEKTTVLVSKRLDEFRERTQPQLGKVHDPIADTLNVDPNHTFGISIIDDKYTAADLLHMRPEKEFLHGKDRKRGLLSIVRQQLKKANYHNFRDLKSAFKFYDPENKGYIDFARLRDACLKFNVPIEDDVLVGLLDYCSKDDDSTSDNVDYTKFINFINWKDKFPNTPSDDNNDLGTSQGDNCSISKKNRSSLRKQIDKGVSSETTYSAEINATVGIGHDKYEKRRTYGVPTVRWDRPAPRTRRISDRTNYGDESDAYGLVCPSVYASHGVYEQDFFELRPKNEIKLIFKRVGVDITDEAFEEIWKRIAIPHKIDGNLVSSVESFRQELDKIQAADFRGTAEITS